MAKLKVFYNSACPVCDAGIRGQRERMAGCALDIQWIASVQIANLASLQ